MKRFVIILVVVLVGVRVLAQETYLYAQKDTSSLYMDIYRAAAGSETEFQGVKKPTVIFMFGGGFVMGTRNAEHLQHFYRLLNDNGYTVVAIDYRLGMKGYKMGKGFIGLAKSAKQFYASQQMAVEDVFSAVSYLSAHPELGIDVQNMVASGNSAGAIISLACARAIANGDPVVPDGFRFKGVMSFAGAIISLHGAPKFADVPCPILFFHGLEDNAVAYKHFGAFGRGMWGSSYYAAQLKKKGGNYSIYRYKNRSHDVAAYMTFLWNEEKAFLENNVMQNSLRIVDAFVDDPALPIFRDWSKMSPQDVYNGVQ